MKHGMAVLRSVVLTLGLLMAVGGTAWAVDGCPPPVQFPGVDFGGVLIGNASAEVVVFGPTIIVSSGLHATITGPNAIEFVVTSNTCDVPTPPSGPTSCQILARFIPMGCGLRTATLTLTLNTAVGDCPAGSPVAVIPLVGFGCSFDCAINATQNASGLSPTVRDRILRELFLAQATTGSIRCAHLNCALCLAQPEALRGRAGAQAIVDQINCLLVVFCSVSSLVGV
jgi:hypothetical protein